MRTRYLGWAALFAAIVLVSISPAFAGNVRSDEHEAYAKELWNYLTSDSSGYHRWPTSRSPIRFEFGPPAGGSCKFYINKPAASTPSALPHGAVVVTEHYNGNGAVAGITAFYRVERGYDDRYEDWYWAHFLPSGKIVKSSADRKSQFDKRGFVAFEEDRRLWVFDVAAPEIEKFLEGRELAKHVIRPGAGPGGMTIKSPDMEMILEYVAAKPGFIVEAVDGRLWIFSDGAEKYEKFVNDGELAKHVIRPAVGPLGSTLKAPDIETINAYLSSKPGFVTRVKNGRIWVFQPGSEELKKFEDVGELAKQVIRPAAGPAGMTVKAPDTDVLLEYLMAQEGFKTFADDGRIWIFRNGSAELKDFLANGELAKHVIRPAAGPGGVTLKAADMETIDDYLRVAQQ